MKIFKFVFMLVTILAVIGCETESNTEPTASIIGATDISIEFGSDFDPLDGVTATDTVDGAIPTTEIIVEGSVDTSVSDTYTLTYKVTGSDGKEVSVTREITVEQLLCGDNQEPQGGVCVIIDQDLEDIKIALNNTLNLTNYQMDVLISYTENTIEYRYEMTLSFDDDVVLFEMGENDITYYIKTTTGMNAYIKQGDNFVLETVDQMVSFNLYEDLEPSWFTKIGDYYLLGNQYVSNISGMLEDYFPDGDMNNFKVGLNEDILDYFKVDVISGDMIYNLTFTFDMIDEVELLLPTV
jgi:hypothetical protein